MSVEICNKALVSLGADTILDITEDSENARKLNVIYEPTLHDLLRIHPWNFAQKRASLAQLTTTPAFGYSYYYQLPSDYERMVSINNQTTIDYVIENGKLACSESSANIIYTAYISDANLYDSNFKEVFSARLAAELAYPIIGSRALSEDFWKLYQIKLSRAISADSQEGKPQKFERNYWKESRS